MYCYGYCNRSRSLLLSLIIDTQPNSPGHVSGWTVDEVVEWLKGIKMGEYVKVFHQKKVDGAELLQYDLKCLGVIGVRKKQHQVKIISELKKLQI